MVPFLAVTIVFALVFLAWLWTLGEFLASLAPPSLRLNVRSFRSALVYPALYFFLFSAVLLWAEPDDATFGLIVPLHLLGMYCMFYSLYFVAKSLRIAELQRAVTFHDYGGAFFLLWFYPVGIWFVQPRVNAMARSRLPAT